MSSVKTRVFHEGFVDFLSAENNLKTKGSIFYNPMMRISRDFTITVLDFLSKELNKGRVSFLDLMAASGVRSLRIIKECSEASADVFINDYSKACTEIIKKNLSMLDYNKSRFKVKVLNREALSLLSSPMFFDFIHIDPFEDINKYLYMSIRSVKNRGVISLTTTDTASLSGTYPKACMRRYNAVPQQFDFKHEFGLRILIRAIQIEGAKQDKALKPILAYYYKHHFGIFMRVIKGRKKSSEVFKDHKYLTFCKNCLSRKITPSIFNDVKCSNCGDKLSWAGKFYTGSLISREFLDFISKNYQKYQFGEETKKIITLIKEESSISTPFTINTHLLFKRYNIKPARISEIIHLLRNAGFKAERTHFNPLSLRTNADIPQIVRLLKQAANHNTFK